MRPAAQRAWELPRCLERMARSRGGGGEGGGGGWRSAGRRGVAWGACCLEKRRAQAEPTGSAERGRPRPGKRVGGDWDGPGCREGSDRWAGSPARRKALACADGAPGTVATARGPTAGCLGKARRGWGATRRRARRRAVRRAGGGRGGSGSTGISSNSAAAEGEEGEGELSGGGARRGQRRARGGDPWEEEPLPREREREGEGQRRAGSGGAAGAAAGAPGGAGAAKATCPPSRSQAATDGSHVSLSVAPATSTPWRVRIAGSMNGPGARRRV